MALVMRDNLTVQEISYNNYNGTGNQLNTWKELVATYTTDGSETGDLAFRITKGWGGSGERIDDIRVVCASCAKKTYAPGNWSSISSWGGESVPSSSQNVIVSHDIILDASPTLGSVTVDASKTLTIADGQTITASGATDINGALNIEGLGKYDADGTFDATGATVTFTGDGRLECASTVTSLGTLSTSSGTVEYDGGTQSVLEDTYYITLEIDQSGTKTAAGNLSIDGNLVLTGGELILMADRTLILKGI